MRQRKLARRNARRGQAVGRLWLRWLALLLLWQGPIPCLHSHELWSAADRSAVPVPVAARDSAWPLLDHLLSFHLADRDSNAPVSGWHLHWVQPESDEDVTPPGPATTGVVTSELLQEVVSEAWQLACPTLDRLPLELAQERVSFGADQRMTGPCHFLDNFAPSLAVPLRLGILRC